MLISVVHQMCTYALYVPPFVQATIIHIWIVLSAGQRHWPWWNRVEKPGVGPRYAYVVHAFPFSAISEGNPCLDCFSILKTTSASSARFERARHALLTVPTLCACKNTPYIHMLMAFEFCLLIFFLLVWNHFLHPWSASRPPIRFEWMATVLITDCVHTPSDCTRAPSRWSTSNYLRVALAVITPSHLLHPRRRHHDDHL